MRGLYPTGLGAQATGDRLTVGFGPENPDYGQIATGAGGAWARKMEESTNIESLLSGAIKIVLDEKRCAVLDCMIGSI